MSAAPRVAFTGVAVDARGATSSKVGLRLGMALIARALRRVNDGRIRASRMKSKSTQSREHPMTRLEYRHRAFPAAFVAAWVVGLAGCGGGGGDGGSPTPTVTLAIDASNVESVAHSTTAGILAMSPVQTLPLTAQGAAALGAGQAGARHVAWLARVVAAAWPGSAGKAAAAAARRAKPLAIVGPFTEPCFVSGTVTTTFNDVDNNTEPSVGDVLTMSFDACRDSADETVDGVVAASFTEIGTTTMRARMTMTQLSDSTALHSTKINGSALLAYEMLSSVRDITRLTADGPVTADISTHLPYADKVTLRSGFAQEVTYDATSGNATISANGILDSMEAGGSVEVNTPSGALFVLPDSADYPTSGALDVRGRTGKLVMTALPTGKVRLDLDADDNGVAESSQSVTWDWLF